MASAFLSSILSKTSQVLDFVRRSAVSPSSSSDPRGSVLEDLMGLERTLKRIQALLHDAEEREIREEAVKLWLKELQGVAYDAEDVLDEYHYEQLRGEVECRASGKRKRVEGDGEEEVIGSLTPIIVSIPDGMGDRIRKIRVRFDEISKDRELLRLREEEGERRVFKPTYPAPTSHMMNKSLRIYGREDDKQKVINLLFSVGMGNGISVIPIVGKGGLGKTTIAQLVYNDSKVKEYFDLTGWVWVSDDFDVARLTKAIIESLTRNETQCNLTELSSLQNNLEQKVKGKRVFLVLDDVWNERHSHWESLKRPLVGAESVKIIMTCRNDSVAEIMQTVRPYHPSCLSEDESWLLFKHYAFGGRESREQSGLVDIGKQIVNKCSGLPLAVKATGSLLSHMTDEDGWMDILESNLWEFDKEDEILPALRLSYTRMPAHLKPCFVYCSMFPKDYLFDKDVLIRLWMAQGYIPSGGNECCTVVDEKLTGLPDEVRHLYVQGGEELLEKSICSHNNLRAIRTLLQINWNRVDPLVIRQVIQFPLLLPRTDCLRTLQFSWKRKDELPDSFGCLKHLRFLHIRSPYIERLPESVCLLHHLQTLILECGGTYSVGHLAELPDGLGNLTNLRYFELEAGRIKRLPESVCRLHHLETLILRCSNLFEGGKLAELPNGLGNLINLRHLMLRSEVIERLPGSICQLRNLHTLDLGSCWQLEELPRGIGSLTNLRHLYFYRSGIHYLPVGIEKLTNLQSLVGIFKVRKDREQRGIEAMKDLVNLQGTLHISSLHNLVNIEDARDAGLKYKHKLEKLLLKYWGIMHDYVGDSLCIDGGPEENMDVPADEKREEAILECLQPHRNLKKLTIDGYGGSKFPKWVGNPFSFASLKQISIIDCKKIRSLPLYIYDALENLDALIQIEPPPSMLETVKIERCQQLTSIAGLHNLHLLKKLVINDCPQLQLLPEEGLLPSKLEYLHIEQCQQLTSIAGLHNLHSLEELKIINCPGLQLLSEEGLLPSKLKNLHIKQCQQLTSIAGLHNLHSLKELSINDCPQLQFLPEEGLLPSKLGFLDIKQCQQLTSIAGLHNLDLLVLIIYDCPKLHITAEDQLLSMPSMVKIVDCPGLVNWCQIQNINCIEVVSSNKLTISNTWENIKHMFDDLTSINLVFSNCWDLDWDYQSINFQGEFEELTIWSCTHIPPVGWLPVFTKSLVIKDCPGYQLLPDEMLPSTLKLLIVHSCENLRSLQLGQDNRDALEELQIVNCPKLTMVEGLNDLFTPKFLRIEQCPQFPLS